MTEQLYPIVLPRQAWFQLRKAKLCEAFTVDELNNADDNNGFIKNGWIAGCGRVAMYLTQPLPIREVICISKSVRKNATKSP